jgi:hypothetical protein
VGWAQTPRAEIWPEEHSEPLLLRGLITATLQVDWGKEGMGK